MSFQEQAERIRSRITTEVEVDTKTLIHKFLFIAAFLSFWGLLSFLIKPELLPTPVEVLLEIEVIISSGVLTTSVANTLRRVLIPFAFAWLLSILIGVGMGFSSRIEDFLDIGIIIGITIPGLAWTVISIMLFGLSSFSAYFAVFIVILPIITINMWKGCKNIDTSLIEMAEVYRFGKLRTFHHVVIPQIIPYVFSAGRFGLALAWKVVVIVEFLGFGNGIGYQIGVEYNKFNMAGVLAWTTIFVCVMLLIEFGIFRTFENNYKNNMYSQ